MTRVSSNDCLEVSGNELLGNGTSVRRLRMLGRWGTFAASTYIGVQGGRRVRGKAKKPRGSPEAGGNGNEKGEKTNQY